MVRSTGAALRVASCRAKVLTVWWRKPVAVVVVALPPPSVLLVLGDPTWVVWSLHPGKRQPDLQANSNQSNAAARCKVLPSQSKRPDPKRWRE